MTAQEVIATIRAEIERRITDNTFGAKLELIDILAWLDTLESEKPMDQDELEEEIHKYNKERFDEYFPEQDGDFISEVDFMTCLGRVARHFAKCGAEHLKK